MDNNNFNNGQQPQGGYNPQPVQPDYNQQNFNRQQNFNQGQYYGQPQMGYPQPDVPQKKENHIFGILALVLGVVGLIAAALGFLLKDAAAILAIGGGVVAIVGLIFGIVDLIKSKKKLLGILGLIISVIGVAVAVVVMLVVGLNGSDLDGDDFSFAAENGAYFECKDDQFKVDYYHDSDPDYYYETGSYEFYAGEAAKKYLIKNDYVTKSEFEDSLDSASDYGYDYATEENTFVIEVTVEYTYIDGDKSDDNKGSTGVIYGFYDGEEGYYNSDFMGAGEMSSEDNYNKNSSSSDNDLDDYDSEDLDDDYDYDDDYDTDDDVSASDETLESFYAPYMDQIQSQMDSLKDSANGLYTDITCQFIDNEVYYSYYLSADAQYTGIDADSMADTVQSVMDSLESESGVKPDSICYTYYDSDGWMLDSQTFYNNK